AVQCGYCIPGVLNSCAALLDRVADPSDADICRALDGNLCRCTGYNRFYDATHDAADARAAEGSAAAGSGTAAPAAAPPQATRAYAATPDAADARAAERTAAAASGTAAPAAAPPQATEDDT